MNNGHRKPISERFWPKVEKRGPDDCWNWTAFKDRKGYGAIQAEGHARPLKAPRVSWELHNGQIPEGLCVLHKCDNPGCVNPAHLFLGTVADNNLDMLKKGRASGGRLAGEAAGSAKLSDATVREMRSLYGDVRRPPVKAIARQYGVSHNTIWKVLTGQTWAHVK